MKTTMWTRGAALLLLAVALPVFAEERTDGDALALWEDPDFKKSFLGSYGFEAEVEPKVSEPEREVLQKILPLMAGNPEVAETTLEESMNEDSSALFDFMLGNLDFQAERLDQARDHFSIAVQKFPSFRRAYKNLGLVLVRQSKFEGAVGALSKVVELGGADGTVYGLLGYAYSALGESVPAESAYRSAMLLEPKVPDWKLGLTQSVLRQRKYGEAATLCEELIAKSPERADYWLLQANAYIGLGEPLKAAENFELVWRMGKANEFALKTLGDIYVNRELWDMATRAYSGAVAIAGASGIERSISWVEVLAQRGATEQAERLLASVKEVGEGVLAATEKKRLLKLEARLAMASGEGSASGGVLEEIVALDPLDGEALMLLGEHYNREGERERAIFFYERAASLDDFEADASVRHAQVLVSDSRFKDAVPLLKRAQEINPRDDVARYLEQVERIARSSR